MRDLGVLLDSELTMKQHVNQVAMNCFYQLRRLRQIRHYAGQDVVMQLVSAYDTLKVGLLQQCSGWAT